MVESRQTKNNAEVLEELDLSVLTLLIKEADAEESHETSDTEKESNLTELMQLFQELIKIPVIRIKVVDVFSVAKMRVLMNEILDGCNDSGFLERPKHFLHVYFNLFNYLNTVLCLYKLLNCFTGSIHRFLHSRTGTHSRFGQWKY